MEESRSRQERLALTQTAVIGTILTAMTAVQTLDYHLPLPAPAKPAVVASLGALALRFSVMALRLARPDAVDRSGRSHPWLATVEAAASGVATASVAWVVVSLASAAGLIPASPPTMVGAIAGGFLASLVVGVWVRRRARVR
jgi:hypothetical protein